MVQFTYRYYCSVKIVVGHRLADLPRFQSQSPIYRILGSQFIWPAPHTQHTHTPSEFRLDTDSFHKLYAQLRRRKHTYCGWSVGMCVCDVFEPNTIYSILSYNPPLKCARWLRPCSDRAHTQAIDLPTSDTYFRIYVAYVIYADLHISNSPIVERKETS